MSTFGPFISAGSELFDPEIIITEIASKPNNCQPVLFKIAEIASYYRGSHSECETALDSIRDLAFSGITEGT